MFSFLRGSSSRRKGDDKNKKRAYSPLASSPELARRRRPGQSVDDDDVDDDEDNRDEDEDDISPGYRGKRDGNIGYFDRSHDENEEDGAGEDEDAVDTPLLPIFSAAHLDRLPLYNITHAIRILVVQRCETTLSWEQLRSPQISQFLVKPIQNQVRENHFNRATLCSLISNCLQFQKEAQTQPGIAGISRTRALICELLAMRLVKEFNTRELIDALSYDFDPLQGMSVQVADRVGGAGTATPAMSDLQSRKVQARGARVSTIEIAIRAQSKRFLAHPLVVQHLEAIWAGTVVFHFEADNLHRKPALAEQEHGDRHQPTGGYGTIRHSLSAPPADSVFSRKARAIKQPPHPKETSLARRSVTLYDPTEASLFKLSRLRVPRYRQVFSTVSFATMLGLFVAVLADRSLDITPLEIVFWVWSTGYMLDELVGFTEQGFGLYIMSFWNAFDLGILGLFVIYYCLRLYGIILADSGKQRIAGMAYDVLASTAVLLFPRLFSVLDHYRYFSQLLIAFRLMAQDLLAILVLILISCSGFFVAFTLSFSGDTPDGGAIAYALFQILMGFTPAAWDRWPSLNPLGQAIMGAFLIICHFLIVTILITVLTNSFMAIVRNAEEEHQFLFAVNTISMVKSDALFSYIAPTNVLGWLLSPTRYLVPFRQYVKLNRTVIKVTHFPMLLVIFAYERIILAGMAYEPTDLIDKPATSQKKPIAFSINRAPELFSPGRRLREPSVISYHKDRALDEVFRRPFKGSTVRTTTREMDPERRNSSNAVDVWMQAAENEGGASPPLEQPRSVLERLENRRPPIRRGMTADRLRQRRTRELSTATRSVASDPDLLSVTASRVPHRIEEESEPLDISAETLPQETDADGDDENNESDQVTPGVGESAISVVQKENRDLEDDDSDSEFFQTPNAARPPYVPAQSAAAKARLQDSPDPLQSGNNTFVSRGQPVWRAHARNASGGTIMLAPQNDDSSASHPVRVSRPGTAKHTNSGGTTTPNPAKALRSGQQTPLKAKLGRPRPVMPTRQNTAPSPAKVGLTFVDLPRLSRRQPSFNARALDLASEIGDNKWGPSGGDAGGIAGIPASFSEQLLRERERERIREEERRQGEEEDKAMVSRIMLARMHTLEEGFKEVLKGIKDLSQNAGSSRRESEVGSEVRRVKPKVITTANSSQSTGMSGTPKTPLSSTVEGTKRSPKKVVRRNTKGKGCETAVVSPEPAAANESAEAASPESVKSAIPPVAANDRKEEEEEEAAVAAAERPGTAVYTPRARQGGEDEDA